MLHKLLLLTLAALFSLPVMAQQAPTNPLMLGGFMFDLGVTDWPNVNVVQYPGDAADLPPAASDAPHTRFMLYDTMPAPESTFDAPAAIRLYYLGDAADYPHVLEQADKLRTLLDERPDLSTTMSFESEPLPFLPVIPHGQQLRARAEYIDSGLVPGIGYIYNAEAAVEPYLYGSFMYTFQGLSGDHYISLTVKLNTDLFPAETPADFDIEAFSENIAAYINESIATLNAGSAENFTPSLETIGALIESFALAG